jgi:neutral ceramidase
MSRKKQMSFVLVILTLSLAAAFDQAASADHARSVEDRHPLQAGVAKIDMTPDRPVKMSGYGSRKDLSTGVHDRLYARVVVFESGEKRLVLVSTELIGFYKTYEPLRDALCERFGLKPSELFLSATHTHSGPTPTFSKEGGPFGKPVHPNNLAYTERLKDKLLKVTGQALEARGPVRIGVGRGHSPVGSNRRAQQADGSIKLGRNPYGPTDKEVLVMKLAKPDGSPIAGLFDYATHATSLGPRNLQISGDVLGIAAQFVEKISGPGVTAPVFAGASGDIDPWYRVLPSFETADGWIPEPVLLGTLLGEEVVHVFRRTKTPTSNGEVKTKFATLELPVKPKESQDEDASSSTKKLNVTVARVGDICFVGLGCELLTEIGMAIKDGSPYEHTFVITHCNGGAGYLPPEHLYDQGGYEVRSSGFGPQAADMLVKKTLQMLSDL